MPIAVQSTLLPDEDLGNGSDNHETNDKQNPLCP